MIKDRMLRELIYLIIGLAAVALCLGTAHLYRHWLDQSEIYALSKIEISGNEFLSQEMILEASGLETGMSLWQVDLAQVQQNIESIGFLEHVALYRKLPDGIAIQVKEKRPVALLKVEGKFLSIDQEGLVLPTTPGRLYDLPIMTGKFQGAVGVGHYAGGVRVKSGLHFLLSILRDRPELYHQVSEVVLGKKEGLLLYTRKPGIPVWVGLDDFGEKIRCLDAILNQLKSERSLRLARYIDLRYDGQVVVGMRT